MSQRAADILRDDSAATVARSSSQVENEQKAILLIVRRLAEPRDGDLAETTPTSYDAAGKSAA
ncbi:FliG C-terminal domain-containing protein [Shigella flexneri]